jgi:hypothetical protein
MKDKLLRPVLFVIGMWFVGQALLTEWSNRKVSK